MWLQSFFSNNNLATKATNLVDDSVRGVGSWIDEQQFTTEERSEASNKMLEFRLRVLESTANENSPRSRCRARLAFITTFSFLFFLVGAALGSIFEMRNSDELYDIAELLYYPFLTVVSFYFVSDIGGNWIDKSRKQK